ncbi:MAG: FecCD family ABC transporter permease, partial [Thermoplasmatota archaeon]
IVLNKIPLLEDHLPEYSGSENTIILLIRLPRVLLGLIAGISLAVSGTSMQGIFKNPMASPFILGVSSGAALGAAVGFHLELSMYWLPIISFIFAMFTVFLVFGLGRFRGKTDIPTLLLAGLALNFLMSALYSYLLFVSSPENRMSILSFTWGSLNGTNWNEIIIVFPLMIVGFIAVFSFSKELNVIQAGEETALQLGVEVERTKIIQLVAGSFLAAAVVAFTGVIGFVGLIIPHAARLVVGPEHKKLIPTSALMGGIFLIVCDSISRISGEIWVGIITGIFGAPFFIYLLVRKRGDNGW